MNSDKVLTREADKTEQSIFLGMRLLAILICGILFYQSASANWDFPPTSSSMFYYAYYVWIITPLHEGGHLLFRFFGQDLHSFGGSFWQVMFPLLIFPVALRQRPIFAATGLILAGTNMMAVAPYIFDARFRVLRLLGPKDGHDWYHLLTSWQLMDSAAEISQFTFFVGFLLGLGGIVFGITVAVLRYLKPPPEVLPSEKMPTNQVINFPEA